MKDLPTEAQRRRAIAWATALTTNTSLEPQAYERQLLERYALGELDLEQVLQQLDTRVQHVLYRSQAVHPFGEQELTALLEESRAWNQVHGITGLLCYNEGHFVQLIEGAPEQVYQLYARIQRDPRHRQVTTLSDAAEAQRFFADWQMAFVNAENHDFYWLLTYLEAREQRLVLPHTPITEPHLLTLLTAFQHVR